MRFLYVSVQEKWDREICKSLEILEQEVRTFSFPEKIRMDEFVILSETNRYALVETLQKKDFDFVFSASYIHEVSVFCNMLGVLYLSWTFEYPNMDLFRNSVTNPCNCFFISDSTEMERLINLGAENVFYLPAAATQVLELESNLPEVALEEDRKEADETETIAVEEEGEKEEKEYQVSYIGKIMETDESSFFDENSTLSAESRGYLDGLVHCQRIVYGMDLLKDGVPAKVMAELKEKYPLRIPADVIAEEWEIYIRKWIYDRINSQERLVLLQGIDNVITVFSDAEKCYRFFSKTKPISGMDKREDITVASKINLYIADRQNQNGIGAEIFEIMAQGGFVLCNFCPEMEGFFVAEEDYVYFEDELDLKQKIRFYLKEEEKRQQIARNGYEKVREEHLIIHRVEQILQMLL